MLRRAYSLLTVKAVREDERVIEGLATTPNPDRYGDVVEPKGAKFTNPSPLLWQHQHDKPVGQVEFGKPTKEGIPFKASIEKIDEPGNLKDRLDEAWQSIKTGLVRGVSIGFRAIEYAFIEGGGIRFIETEILELSLVTIPANAEATIQTVKSLDQQQLAASGPKRAAVVRLHSSPGVPGPRSSNRPEEGNMDINKQVADFTAKRAAVVARMEAIMAKADGEGRTLDESEQQDYDAAQAEVESVDKHLGRLRQLQSAQAAGAKAITTVTTPGGEAKAAAVVRGGGDPIIMSGADRKPKGVPFAQVVKCIAFARGDLMLAQSLAQKLYKDDQRVVNIVKAAVEAGSTASGNWLANLVGDETAVVADFIEYLRPRTILGQFGANGVPSLRNVPFRVPLVSQTGKGNGYWVGEGKAKPLTKFSFARTTLEPLKVANITVATEEALRATSPAADVLLRDSLADALRERLDLDFVDPTKAASAGISPASITNGVTPVASSGNDADAVRADLKALFEAFIAANNPPTSGVFIMSSVTALALSLMTNALGQREFANLGMTGGTLNGLPVIVSDYLSGDTDGGHVILANAQDIYLADEGGIAIAVSREASLEMSDAPSHDSVTPTAASLVSMFQTNSVAIRAERIINWAKRRSSAVAWLSAVNWGAPSS
jgi:HK97 family phage major capsid protein/HK97 family phage prohead protease